MTERLEAQCDCELDSPGLLSHLVVEEQLLRWREWALYLKQRIETHYRPRIVELEAERDALKAENEELREVERDVWLAEFYISMAHCGNVVNRYLIDDTRRRMEEP